MHMQSWDCISTMSVQAFVLKAGVNSLGEGSEGDQGAPPAVFGVIHVLSWCTAGLCLTPKSVSSVQIKARSDQ